MDSVLCIRETPGRILSLLALIMIFMSVTGTPIFAQETDMNAIKNDPVRLREFFLPENLQREWKACRYAGPEVGLVDRGGRIVPRHAERVAEGPGQR